MKYTLLLGVVFCGLSLATTGHGQTLHASMGIYDAEDCGPVVNEHLDKLSIDRSKIKVIDYITRYLLAGELGEEKEYEAWVSFFTCKGNLVINLGRSCYIQQTYSTYECKSKNLPTK